MNYEKLYNNLIDNAKNRQINLEYYEIHHIIPRCMNGPDDADNLVKLTLREHYICHKLLTLVYPDNRSLANAFWQMTLFTKKALEKYKNNLKSPRTRAFDFEKINITNREFEWAKLNWLQRVKNNPVKRTENQLQNIINGTKLGMQNIEVLQKCRSNLGKRHYYNKETKQRHLWKPNDPEPDMNIYCWGRPKLSDEHKRKLSETQTQDKTLCKIGETNFRYLWYKKYIKSVPECFINLNKKNSNSLKSFMNKLYEIKKYLQSENLFIYKYFLFSSNKLGLKIISPAIYEVCLDILDKDVNIIANRIKEHLEEIKELNKKYIADEYLQYFCD